MEKKLVSAQDRLMQGQRFRQNTREDNWRESYDQYMGEQGWNTTDDPTADLVSVNISFSTLNTLVPFTADENPTFVVEPYSGDATSDNAALLQSFLNRLWQSSDVAGTLHLREAAFDNLLYGDGYLKVGYEIKQKQVYDVLGNPVDSRIDVGHFSVERINPWDVWVDPYSDGIYNARWVCQRIQIPREELENDPRYKVRRDTNLGGVDSDFQSEEDRERLDLMEDWVSVYEFYDLVDRWMLSFVEGARVALRYIEHVTCPIVQMPNYRIPNSPYHIGELEQIASLQLELNKTRSQMITHRRRNVAKWMARSQYMNEDAEEAMKSSKVNDIIPVDGNEPFDEMIKQIVATPLSQDSYALDAQIRADINEVSGVNEYLRGVPQNISRTATEATIIEGATNIRTRHKLLQVETAAQQVGQLLLDIIRDVLPLTNFEEMRQYITGREAEKLNRATGQDNINTDLIFTPTPEIFQGRYEIKVERGSTELRNPEVKANKLAQMVGMMLQATPVLLELGIPFNIKRLMEMWFEAEGIEDVDALFEIEEQQQLMQQLQLLQRAGEAQAAAQGGQQGGGAAAPSAGEPGPPPTLPGEPRPQTTGAPADLPSELNSGILSPRAF